MTKEDVAKNLIFPLFRGISDAYKSNQFAGIWEQVETRCRAAARSTNSLPRWLETVTAQLRITITNEYMNDVLEVMNAGQDEEILDWIRNETTLLVMYARLLNQNRKEFMKLRAERLNYAMPEGANKELPDTENQSF